MNFAEYEFLTGFAVLAASAVKGTAILLGAAVAALGARRAPASARHLVWAGAMAALLLLPVLATSLPQWTPSSKAPALLLAGGAVPAAAASAAIPSPRMPPASRRSPDWRSGVFALWAVVALAMLARLAGGLLKASSIARSGAPWLEQGIRRSDRAEAPFVWGLLRPVVLLPWDAVEWTRERLELVLLHERAHIQRRDSLTHLAAEIARALYWFHPLVHYAARKMHLERERACDDCVLRGGADAAGYAGHLLALARSSALPAVAMAAPSQLGARLRAILDATGKRRPAGPAAIALAAAAVVAVAAPLAALRAQSGFPVSGIVLDASGAVVPDARVILSAVEGAVREQTVSGPAGEFSLPPVPPALYQMAVEKPGFQRYLRVLRITGDPIRQNVILKLGEISEEVTVTAQRTSNAPPPSGPHRIRVGGSVQAAKLERHVRPQYPREARDRNAEGTVLLQAVVLMDGSVGGLRVFSSPDPALSEAALAAVREWRYQPTLLNGQPVEVVTTVTVNFRLTP